MQKHVWLLITSDKYELPLAVADTATELGKMTNTTSHNIVSSWSKFKAGVLKTCRFRKVEFDD